ncbi:MAG TPA: hypothetical protein PKH31_15000 [Candidatus Sumerlaeota bacterium]|nr:hypothetical protein [Candidatus Sumerlaeota bacterium]
MRITGLSVAILVGCFGWAVLFAHAQDPAAPTSPTLGTEPPAAAPPEAAEPPKTTPPVEEIPSEPIPEKPQAQDGLVAPLGLTDVHYLLQRVQLLVESNTTTAQLARYQKEAIFCLDQSRRYMEQVLRGQAESVTYRWTAVNYNHIHPGPAQYRDFSPTAPVAGVMALRLRTGEVSGPAARRGAIYVEEIEITDSDGEVTTQTVNRWVAPNRSRHEVVYLDRPVTLRALWLRAHHEGELRYRLYVEAGVPDPPDYPREVVTLLRGALGDLEKGDLNALQTRIVLARERLGEFQESYAPPHNILKNRKMKRLKEDGERRKEEGWEESDPSSKKEEGHDPSLP